MKYLRMFKVKRDEWLASALMLLTTICLHALVIARNYDLFTQTNRRCHSWTSGLPT